MDLIDPKQPPEAMVNCPGSTDYHRNDLRCYYCRELIPAKNVDPDKAPKPEDWICPFMSYRQTGANVIVMCTGEKCAVYDEVEDVCGLYTVADHLRQIADLMRAHWFPEGH